MLSLSFNRVDLCLFIHYSIFLFTLEYGVEPNTAFFATFLEHANIISLFTNNCLAHCKTYVLLRVSSDVLPKAATALTTKITVTGKAGITFYWADHTFALRLS